MNYLVTFRSRTIRLTERGVETDIPISGIYATLPQAKSALRTHLEKKIADIKADIRLVRGIKEKDLTAEESDHDQGLLKAGASLPLNSHSPGISDTA